MSKWNEIYQKGSKEYQYYDFLQPHKDLDKVIQIFREREVDKILDVGCGAGRNLIPLVRQGFDVSGVDLAPEGIKRADDELEKEGLSANLAKADIFESLPYKDEFFDAVVSVQVLQHGMISQIKRGIAEIERVLAPEGLVFITLCGRYSQGGTRYCLVKTARKIADRTYVPTKGSEVGLPHFIYNRKLILEHYNNFEMLEMWRDSKDYYCFIGKKKQ